jgi:hypothetical protein
MRTVRISVEVEIIKKVKGYKGISEKSGKNLDHTKSGRKPPLIGRSNRAAVSCGLQLHIRSLRRVILCRRIRSGSHAGLFDLKADPKSRGSQTFGALRNCGMHAPEESDREIGLWCKFLSLKNLGGLWVSFRLAQDARTAAQIAGRERPGSPSGSGAPTIRICRSTLWSRTRLSCRRHGVPAGSTNARTQSGSNAIAKTIVMETTLSRTSRHRSNHFLFEGLWGRSG